MFLGLQKPKADQGPLAEIVSNAQMRQADAATIEAGVPGYNLMTAAGQSVANIVHESYPHHTVLVLCGPGNNGGDGFVAAMFLKGLGHRVEVMSLVSGWKLKGDAKTAYKDWGGKALGFKKLPELPADTVVIDAVFGTGLSKPLEEPVTSVFQMVREQDWPVVAVDIPSGVNGDTGAADPAVLEADYTVTFFRKKLGHVLMPGMGMCGPVSVHDIGIEPDVLAQTDFAVWENDPALWREKMPHPGKDGHKYSRGHLVILGGARMTGAARLASEAAMRAGAGLCTIAADREAKEIYQKGAAHILYEELRGMAGFPEHLADSKRNVGLIGPGAGLDDADGLRRAVLGVLETGKPAVLDADALSCFADDPGALHKALHEKAVLTPHDGEFARIFPSVEGVQKLGKVERAAALCPAVVLLKGADTVIAQAGRKSVINTHATPWLATAGSGDVLAGIIAGLMAQNMPAFEAACAGAWIHGEAAERKGPGLVAPDIIEEVPAVLRDFA
ncbi:MAG: NAD(P)H-hydrate dehydratase [Rhodospirillales bacterium]|nr:NAD(P)H-hydrate dehydratase [Rhodospirillales bacterium]MCB9995565.1 NAD(P)H-hydrate dehydratase [Rhodospirillales bacterium]